MNFLACIFFSSFFKFSNFYNHNTKKYKRFVFSKYNFTAENFINEIIKFDKKIFLLSRMENTERQFKYLDRMEFNIYFYSTARFYFRFNKNKNINFLMKFHKKNFNENFEFSNYFLPAKNVYFPQKYFFLKKSLNNFPVEIFRYKKILRIFTLFYYFGEKNEILNGSKKYFQLKLMKLRLYLDLLYNLFDILNVPYEKFTSDLSKNNLYIVLYLKTLIKNLLFQVILIYRSDLKIFTLKNDIFDVKDCFSLKKIVKKYDFTESYKKIKQIFDNKITFINIRISKNKNRYEIFHIYKINKTYKEIFYTSYDSKFEIDFNITQLTVEQSVYALDNILHTGF